jgi:hypothetical protein
MAGRDDGRQVDPPEKARIREAVGDRFDSGADRLKCEVVDPDAGEDPRAVTSRPPELGTGSMMLHKPILSGSRK